MPQDPQPEQQETDATTIPELGRHELVNRRGDRVRLLNYGARVETIDLALKNGRRRITLGYERPAAFVDDRYFLGATIGRFANRIRDAGFRLDGRDYALLANEGPHQLHGGGGGFHRRYWTTGGGASDRQVEYCLVSADGDQGWPGRLRVCVRISWNDERELAFHYSASTDRPTHVSLTNHTYFNLDGVDAENTMQDVLDHRVTIDADAISDIDADLLPTGGMLGLSGTALDLRRPRSLRELVLSDDPRVAVAGGVDFNYVLTGNEPAAILVGGRGDLEMSVVTTCPGLQLYSGQNLGPPFAPYQGVCLEAQYFPDSPNQPQFPSTLLVPGQLYNESTAYRFAER